MKRAFLLAFSSAFALGCLGACSTPAPADGGTPDASPNPAPNRPRPSEESDLGHPGATDASTDGASDISEDDKLGEDAWSGLEADWEAVPGTPDWCPSRVRLNPATAQRGIHFSACRGAQAGCAEFVPAGGPLTTRRYLTQISEEATFINEKPHFLIRRNYFKRGEHLSAWASIDTLSSLDGDVAFEHARFRVSVPTKPGQSSRRCGSAVGFDQGRVVGSFRSRDFPDGGVIPSVDVLWSSTLGPQARIEAHPVDGTTYGMGPDDIAVRGSNLFVTFLPDVYSISLALLRLPSWERTPLAPNVAKMRLLHPRPVERGAIVKGGPDFTTDRIYFLSNDGTVERLWQAAPGRSAANVHRDRSNADQVVWMDAEPHGMFGTDFRLWTSPLASRESDFAPRCVGQVPFNVGAYSVANRGVAVITSEDHNLLLVRYSDGMAWSLPASPTFKWLDAVWVDDTYVWIAASTNMGEGSGSWWAGNAIVRIERSTLGAPRPLAPCSTTAPAAKDSGSPPASPRISPGTVRTSH